jgi:quinolinate synthase
VVEASDDSGSTAKIKSVVEKASAGSGWVIGTELNMVQRLAAANRDKRVQPLAASVCEEMSKNRRRSLLSVLRSLRSGDFTNQLVLPADVKENARAAISRMLELS